MPIPFDETHNALAACNGTIKLPRKDGACRLDDETERVIAIGKPCRNVAEAAALGPVAGC